MDFEHAAAPDFLQAEPSSSRLKLAFPPRFTTLSPRTYSLIFSVNLFGAVEIIRTWVRLPALPLNIECMPSQTSSRPCGVPPSISSKYENFVNY